MELSPSPGNGMIIDGVARAEFPIGVFGDRRLATLLVAAIPLAGLNFRFGLPLDVLNQGTTLVVGFLKPSLSISSDIAFVSAGIYQLAFAASFFIWHKSLLVLEFESSILCTLPVHIADALV